MEKLFQRLKIKPKNLILYETAFSHSSYANEHRNKKDYERLEFLGDAVVDLVVADYLFQKEDESEGKMTKLRSSYVCENALYEYSVALGLPQYIKVGHGEEKYGGKYKKAIVADIFEALVGAIYIDLGYATAKRVVMNIIVPYIKDPTKRFFQDYKSMIQEYVQMEQKSLVYQLVDEKGPAHEKVFTIELKIDGITLGMGIGGSKKEAEQEAARNALSKVAKLPIE